MNPILATVLTLLMPVIPWIAFSPWWVVGRWQTISIGLLVLSGIILDLWWGKTLGLTSLVLLILLLILWSAVKAWPASGRSFWPVAVIFSLVYFEVYLLLT